MPGRARSIRIGDRSVGAGHPVFIVAEVSANHNQSFDTALEILEAAKEAGADAVKVQTYTADTITLDSDKPSFRIEGTIWDGRRLHELYREAYTPWDWQPKLQARARELGLEFFSSPFDSTAVDFLETLSLPVYKIASFECVDLPLIRRIARTGKPAILSTGMASLAEIEEALRAFREARGREIALLKCVSSYPAPVEEMNLRTIPHLADTFDVPAGLSDHSMGVAVPVAAAALGATIIEKHFTLSRSVPGPDSAFSLEPAEFKAMVEAVRVAEEAIGGIAYGGTAAEEKSRAFRRSLFVVEDVEAGEPFTEHNVRSIRPAKGLHTRYLEDVLGRRARRRIERGTPLSWELVAEE